MISTPVHPPPTPEHMLSSSPIPELRRLIVVSSDDEVVITGRVSSYYLKQMAQEAIRTSMRGRQLRNQVVVTRA